MCTRKTREEVLKYYEVKSSQEGYERTVTKLNKTASEAKMFKPLYYHTASDAKMYKPRYCSVDETIAINPNQGSGGAIMMNFGVTNTAYTCPTMLFG